MKRGPHWLVPAGIVVLFFGPLLLALVMRSGWWDWEPRHKTNRGRLVEPPVHVGDLAPELTGKWVLAYAYEAPCGAICEADMAELQRIQKAGGRHRDRIAAAGFPVGGSGGVSLPGGPGHVFVLDPAGNIILAYAPGFDPDDINRDLKRLLKWSEQGE